MEKGDGMAQRPLPGTVHHPVSPGGEAFQRLVQIVYPEGDVVQASLAFGEKAIHRGAFPEGLDEFQGGTFTQEDERQAPFLIPVPCGDGKAQHLAQNPGETRRVPGDDAHVRQPHGKVIHGRRGTINVDLANSLFLPYAIPVPQQEVCMRLKVALLNPRQVLPQEYRRVFLSLLKKALEQRGLVDLLYARKRTRPYVFSAYLGREMAFDPEEKVFHTGERLTLWFSTGDVALGAEMLAGLVELRNRPVPYGPNGLALTVERVDVVPEPRVPGRAAVFRTLGVVVLTDPREEATDMDRWYVLPDDPRFPEVFSLRSRERYQWIVGVPYTGDLEVEVLRWKMRKVRHYGQLLKGFSGAFRVKAHPEMLEFLYQYGVGVRTGQGFGFVDFSGGEA